MKDSKARESLYCSFFQKTGACMHGHACSRMHISPEVSNSLLLTNFYQNPLHFASLLPSGTLVFDDATINHNFDEFYVDIYDELREFGPISDLIVAGNLCEHLVGNVIVIYENIEDAISAYNNLRGRFYAGRPIDVSYTPVSNAHDAICKDFAENRCRHNERCNFIHPKYPSRDVLEECPLTHSVTGGRQMHGDYQDRQRGGKDRDDRRDHERDRNRKGHSYRDQKHQFYPQHNRYPHPDNQDQYAGGYYHQYNQYMPPSQRQEYPIPPSGEYQYPPNGQYQYPQPGEGQQMRYPQPGESQQMRYPQPGEGQQMRYPQPGESQQMRYPQSGDGQQMRYPQPGEGQQSYDNSYQTPQNRYPQPEEVYQQQDYQQRYNPYYGNSQNKGDRRGYNHNQRRGGGGRRY